MSAAAYAAEGVLTTGGCPVGLGIACAARHSAAKAPAI